MASEIGVKGGMAAAGVVAAAASAVGVSVTQSAVRKGRSALGFCSFGPGSRVYQEIFRVLHDCFIKADRP